MSSAHSSTQSSASGPVLGIDLGTTNSVVAVADGTQARVLADPDGRRLIPSVVSFHPDGSILVGHEARERRLVDARNTVYSIKRLIGRPFSSVEVQKARERFAFELEPSKVGGVQVKVRRGTFALPEISAMVLRHLRKNAEAALDQPCSRAVITVPANFNELQRSATQAAGKVAGLDVLRILNEPTAATLAYGYGKEKPESVAVYDLGGGTFDITILDLDKDVFEVVSTAGDTFLGGDDIDLLLAERMADACLRELRYDAKADPQSFERLRAAAEWAKCQLSIVEEVEVTLEELFHEANGRAVHFTYRTTRAELEERMRPLIARTFDVVVEALREAGRRPKEIDSVVLVGGSTRIPLVRHMVREHFGREPRMDIDPDLVVAQGAAIHAFNLSGEKRGSLRPKGPKALGRVALRKITVADHKAAKAKSNAEKMPKQPAFAPEDPRDAVAVGTLSLDDEWKDSPTRVAPEAEMAKARAESRRPPAPAPASAEPAKPAASEALPARPKRKSVVIEEVAAPRRDRRDDAPARRVDERQDVPRSDGRALPAMSKPAVGKPVVPPPRVPRPAPIATDDDEPTTFGSRDALQLARDEVPSQPIAPTGLAQGSLAQGSLAQGSLAQGGSFDSLPSLMDPGLDPFGAGAPPPSVLEPAPDPLGSLAGAPRPPIQPVAVMAPPQAVGTPLLDLDPVEATPERHAATPARRAATSPGITPFDLDDPMVSSVHPMAPAPPPAPVVKVAPARPIADPPRPPPPPPPRAPMMSPGPSPDAPAVLSPGSLSDDFGFPPVPVPSAALPLVMDTAPRIPEIQMSERAAPLLMDVTPLSLGIETVGGYCQPIVGRNAPIPTEKTRVFSTARDDQDRVELRVCQGESNRFEENQSLGTLLLDEIRKARRGEVRVEVTFMIDASGILDVKATDLDTKRVQSIRIALKGGLDHGEIDAMRGRQAELFPTG